MKPRPLKPTPVSSPLTQVRLDRLDRYGEPTHPDLVRDPTGRPQDEDFDGVFWGPCLDEDGTIRRFWFRFDDAEERAMVVRSHSYSAGAKAARTAFEQCECAKIVQLVSVEIDDELSEKREAIAALQPRTHWW